MGWQSMKITSVSVFEVRLGLALLPRGRRRRTLEQSFDGHLNDDLEGRILSFDAVAAAEAASLAATRQRAGNPVDIRDTQIAGIALARRASIATRNLRHFEGLSVADVSPWSEESAAAD
jgi:predicted nucleic acid-binding protein